MSKADQIKSNINSLEGELRGLDESLQLDPDELLPPVDMLDGIQDIEVFDYDKELAEIQVDCEETLSCLSSLYLRAEDVEKKNIHNIIKNDAKALAELNFTISCSKRATVNLMRNIDMGLNDPELYKSLGVIQKEIRDTIKLAYDIQKKMKDFYKDIKEEIKELNKGDELEDEIDNVEISDEENYVIMDLDKVHNELDNYRNKDEEDVDEN